MNFKKIEKLFLPLLFLILIYSSCTKSDISYKFEYNNNDSIVFEDFEFFETNVIDDFYFKNNVTDTISFSTSFNTDDSGVILVEYNDSLYYNPVSIAQAAFKFINSFYITNDSNYLRLSEVYAQKLISISEDYKNSTLFPYTFEFTLHRYFEKMNPNWYSGMAQGQALSLFCKLYSITGKDIYYLYAQNTINSYFLEYENPDDPWVGIVDSSNYLWIEEYPTFPANYTLNGFLFSIVGAYDWYKINKNNEAKGLLSALVTTAKYNVERFRVVGDVSYYCIKHKVQSENYHRIHKEQIEWLYLITKDEKFLEEFTFFDYDH